MVEWRERRMEKRSGRKRNNGRGERKREREDAREKKGVYAVTVVVVVENSVTEEEKGRGHRYFERRTREREGVPRGREEEGDGWRIGVWALPSGEGQPAEEDAIG